MLASWEILYNRLRFAMFLTFAIDSNLLHKLLETPLYNNTNILPHCKLSYNKIDKINYDFTYANKNCFDNFELYGKY